MNKDRIQEACETHTSGPASLRDEALPSLAADMLPGPRAQDTGDRSTTSTGPALVDGWGKVRAYKDRSRLHNGRCVC